MPKRRSLTPRNSACWRCRSGELRASVLLRASEGWVCGQWIDEICVGNRPIIWMLHVSCLWIPAGFAMLALSVAGVVPHSLAVHVLTVGAIGGAIIAMVTRTALGHTGRKLVAGPWERLCYWLMIPGTPYGFWLDASGACWIRRVARVHDPLRADPDLAEGRRPRGLTAAARRAAVVQVRLPRTTTCCSARAARTTRPARTCPTYTAAAGRRFAASRRGSARPTSTRPRARRGA